MINILDLTFEDAEISKVGLLKCERCRLMWFAAAEYRKSFAGE